MSYLLDAQVIIWALTEPDKLKPPVLSLFEPGEIVRVISPLSFWELEIKEKFDTISRTNKCFAVCPLENSPLPQGMLKHCVAFLACITTPLIGCLLRRLSLKD